MRTSRVVPDQTISPSKAGPRSRRRNRVVNEGDNVKVKVIGFDKRGKVRLSMKEVDQNTGNA